jgi:methionyl-tRNA synthetase
LKRNGYIYKEKVQQFYCERDKRPLPDRFVKGTCPYCGAEDQYSDYCEVCGRTFSSLDVKNPKCVICGEEPVVRESDHYFFDLPAFEEKLKTWINSNKVRIQSDVKNYVMNWINEGLRTWDITRDMEWGVPIPGENNKVLYVWFDAPIHYVTATKEWCEFNNENWEDYWKSNETKIIHFIGKDIIYHHCLFWPAMLMGMEDYNLPYAITVRGHVTLEGKKMSKSRKWYISLRKYLENYPSDYLRFYYTLTTSNDTRDGDFSIKGFSEVINKVLIGDISNFANRVLTLVWRLCEGKIPEPHEFGDKEKSLIEKKSNVVNKLREVKDSIDLKDGLEHILELTRMCNAYLNDIEPWRVIKTDPQIAKTSLYISTQLTRDLAILLVPFTPKFSQQLWNMLGFDDSVNEYKLDDVFEEIKSGHKIKEPKPILKPVDEKEGKTLIG